MRTRHFLALALPLLTLTLLTGCLVVAAAGAAGGTIYWMEGKLVVTVDGTPEQIAAAANTALTSDLKMPVIASQATAVDAEITARTADDTRVKIWAKSVSAKSSEVQIRVGNWGDKEVSQRVLDAIKLHLH